ncbi:MAG: hypothetical protein U0837_01265 [Dehalococcoidia bacterium]|jgi:hypothetical protein
MTRLESVLAQALELSEDDREILLIHVGLSLEEQRYDRWSDPALIAELDRRAREADEHPEILMDWKKAEKFIFGGPTPTPNLTPVRAGATAAEAV